MAYLLLGNMLTYLCFILAKTAILTLLGVPESMRYA